MQAFGFAAKRIISAGVALLIVQKGVSSAPPNPVLVLAGVVFLHCTAEGNMDVVADYGSTDFNQDTKETHRNMRNAEALGNRSSDGLDGSKNSSLLSGKGAIEQLIKNFSRLVLTPMPGLPETGHPIPGRPETGHPIPGRPETGHPIPGRPETGHPIPGGPETGHPIPGPPETGHPIPGRPETGHPMPGRPESPETLHAENETSKAESGSSVEHRIVEYILKGYDKRVRPSKSSHDLTHVFVEFSLFNVLKLDIRNEVLQTNAEFITKWVDSHLMWNPRDFGGVQTIRIPFDEIWNPDIVLYNTAVSDYESSILNTNAIVRSSGEIELTSHTLFSSICDVDPQWYPFDQQNCDLSFASWTIDESEVQLILGPSDISAYVSNPEFYLENFYALQTDLFNPCCEYPMSAVVYHIQLQRRSKFAFFFYIMPGILINICAVMVFSLPAESNEKMGLSINSLLALIVFLTAMSENLPPNEKLPLAGIYYGICLAIVTGMVAFSVLVLNVHVTGERAKVVPFWIKYLTVKTSKLLFFGIPEAVKEDWRLDEDKNLAVDVFTRRVPEFEEENSDSVEVFHAKSVFKEIKDPFERRVVAALETLARIHQTQEALRLKAVRRKRLEQQWGFISRVLDRLFFIGFFVGSLVFSLIILSSSPFRERFEYCPTGDHKCEGLTEEEILAMAHQIAEEAAKGHSGSS